MWGGFISNILMPIVLIVAFMLVVRFLTRGHKWSFQASMLAFCVGVLGWLQLVNLDVL